MRGKEDAYVDVEAQELKGKSGSLATDIAVCYVRLDAQNTTRVRVGCSHGSIGGGRWAHSTVFIIQARRLLVRSESRDMNAPAPLCVLHLHSLLSPLCHA